MSRKQKVRPEIPSHFIPVDIISFQGETMTFEKKNTFTFLKSNITTVIITQRAETLSITKLLEKEYFIYWLCTFKCGDLYINCDMVERPILSFSLVIPIQLFLLQSQWLCSDCLMAEVTLDLPKASHSTKHSFCENFSQALPLIHNVYEQAESPFDILPMSLTTICICQHSSHKASAW